MIVELDVKLFSLVTAIQNLINAISKIKKFVSFCDFLENSQDIFETLTNSIELLGYFDFRMGKSKVLLTTTIREIKSEKCKMVLRVYMRFLKAIGHF